MQIIAPARALPRTASLHGQFDNLGSLRRSAFCLREELRCMNAPMKLGHSLSHLCGSHLVISLCVLP